MKTDDFKNADLNTVLDEMQREEQRAKAESSINMAFQDQTAPDQKAEALRLSQKAGLPVDVVERNIDDVKKDVSFADLDINEILNDAPEAEKWLSDNVNAQLVKDDFSMLGRIKKTLSDVPESFSVSMDKAEMYPLLEKRWNGTASPAELHRLDELNKIASSPRGTGGLVSTGFLALAESSVPMTMSIGQGVKTGLATGLSFGGVAALVGQAGPQVFTPEEVITVPTAAAMGAKIGFATGSVTESTRQMRLEFYNAITQLRDDKGNRIDEDLARRTAIVVGAVSGPLEFIGFKKALEPFDPTGRIAEAFAKRNLKKLLRDKTIADAIIKGTKQLGEGYATEFTTEGLQQLAQIIGEEYAKSVENNRGSSFSMRDMGDIASETGEAAVIGGIAGGYMNVPAAITVAARERKSQRNPAAVSQQIEALNNEVKNSPLYQRSPERFYQLANDFAGDDRFYIDQEAIASLVNSLSEDDRSALYNSMPYLMNDLETAEATGADVSIRKADYATFIAPMDQANSLKDYMKLDPEDQSVAQLQATQSLLNANPHLAQAGQEIAQELPMSAQEMIPYIERVVRKAIIDGGRSNVEAKAAAQLFSRSMARFSAGLGEDGVRNLINRTIEFETRQKDGTLALNEDGSVRRGSTTNTILQDVATLREGGTLRGIEDSVISALQDFGTRLEASGITLEQAASMNPNQLIQAVYNAVQNDPQLSAGVNEAAQAVYDNMQRADISLSAATEEISGLRTLWEQARNGDETAHQALNQFASNMLQRLLSGLGSVKININANTGLYGGAVEPSLGVSIEFDESERAQVLAVLAQFATNTNQQQVHVRQHTIDTVGTMYDDGSYATPYFRISVNQALSRAEIDQLIESSGLYGLTFNDGYVEAYYVGQPDNEQSINAFVEGYERIIQSIGDGNGTAETATHRIWVYGEGDGATPYSEITGDIRTQTPRADANAILIAERYASGEVRPAEQAKEITPQQATLQRVISEEYEALPDNDMENPLVLRAYEELVAEVIQQYRALPIKVVAHVKRDADGRVLLDENGDHEFAGEPYENSVQMRRDVQDKNRLVFLPTGKSSFGPSGVSFDGHPLLQETEFRDENGYPMLANDVFRVVHDYYAHNMTPAQFGAMGEEAAWKNHMTTLNSPWARWALTSETRGQNSWVNFRSEVYGKNVSPSDKGFARQKAALLPVEYSLTGDPVVDGLMNDFIAQLDDNQKHGSLTQDQRVTADSLNQMAPSRNNIGMYSAVEKGVIDLKFPQWEPKSKLAPTPEEQAFYDEHIGKITSTADENYPKLKEIGEKIKKAQGAARGEDIWNKISASGFKKEELEWLGLEDYLKLDPNETFTREDVANFVRENGVHVEEVYADKESSDIDIEFDEEVLDAEDHADFDYYEDAIMSGEYSDQLNEKLYELVDDYREQIINEFEDEDMSEAILNDPESFREWLVDNDNEKMEEVAYDLAREMAIDSYDNDPQYQLTHEASGVTITGNDHIGWYIQPTGDVVYSQSEAEIRARETIIDNGDMVSDENVAKWGDYIMGGPSRDYRERKIVLPSVSGTFVNSVHFDDENIVAFTRETTRDLYPLMPEDYNIHDEIPDETSPDFDEDGIYGERAIKEVEARSREAVLESFRLAGIEVDEGVMNDFSSWESAILDNMLPLEREAFKESERLGGMQGSYQKLAYTENTRRELYILAGEYRKSLLEKRYAMDALAKRNSTTAKLERSRYSKKKAFFIEEMQSDWHQDGRQYGYDGDPKIISTEGWTALSNGGDTPVFDIYDKNNERINQVYADTAEEAIAKTASMMQDRLDYKAPPDAPFKGDGWMNLALKRALVDAIDSNAEQFAWATADVLTDRWSEKYRALYEMQYNKKMPSIVKKLTGIEPQRITLNEDASKSYWVIDITPELRDRVKNEAFPLFQGGDKGDPNGYITFNPALRDDFEGKLQRVVITFTEKANFSTSVHEFAHFGVASHRMFASMARERIAAGDSNPELSRIVDDWEKLKEKVGATSDVFNVEQEEHIARMFEVYMREGNAPSETLRRTFTRFRDWLTSIYRDVSMLNADLDDEVRGVFDRWLASENEIAKVKGKNDALASIARNLGLPDDIVDRVSSYVNAATMEAEEKLFKQLNKEQKSRQTKAYQEEYDKLRPSVEDDLREQREYQIIHFLKEKEIKLMDGPELEGVQTDILSDADDATHPDLVADLFGYESGAALIRALKKLPDFDRAVDAEIRKRLQSKFPDMIKSGRIEHESLSAILNDQVVLALDLMIKELSRSFGGNSKVSLKNFAKSVAQNQVEDMKMSNVNYAFRYEVARDKENKAALTASRNGDVQGAMIAMQKAMINQAVFKKLEEVAAMREKAEDLFWRVSQKDKKLAQRYNIDYVNAARAILSKFGLGAPDRFDLHTWMTDLAELDQDAHDRLALLTSLIATPAKDAKDLTTAEYRDIYNAVQVIMTLARVDKETNLHARKSKRDQILGELSAKMTSHKQTPVNESTQVHGKDALRQTMLGLKAILRRVESWSISMDGGFGGPFHKYIYQPVAKASNEYKQVRSAYMKELNDVLKKHEKYLNQKGKIETGMSKSGTQLVFRDRLELIGFLMHIGNESNREKLLDGYRIPVSSFEQSMAKMMADGRITKTDFDIAQSLGDIAEKLKGVSQKAHKSIYGYRFEEIGISPIVTPFGVYRGWYWPAIIDTDQVDSKNIEAALAEQKQFMLASTNKGFTKGRVDGYRKPLSTDLRLASNHIDTVLKFAYLEPAVRDVARIIENQNFKDRLKAIDSEAYSGMLRPWLQRSANQLKDDPPKAGVRGNKTIDKLWKFLNSSSSAQIIMFNIPNAFQNATGFLVGASKLGYLSMGSAFMRYNTHPIKVSNEVRELSTYMSNRMDVRDNDAMNGIENILQRRGAYKKFNAWANLHGYVFQTMVQGYVDVVVWTAAYDKAMSENKGQIDAIQYADYVVRETQGSMEVQDMSEFETGGSAGSKLFKKFYTYFNTQGNYLTTEATILLRDKGIAATPNLLYLYLSAYAIPSFVAEFIVDGLRNNLPEDDDDDGQILDDWIAYFFRTQFRYATAMVPYVGQAANAIANSFDGGPMDGRVSMSPAISLVETTIKAGSGLYKKAQGENVDNSNQIRATMMGIGFMTHLPIGQISKPITYVADVQEGDTHPESIGDWGRGLIAGPPPKK